MDTSTNPPNYSESANDLTEHQDDVVITVMGDTGAGKTSFIKLLISDTSIKIGYDLDSESPETSDIQIYHFRDPDSGRKVTFVDTPGFDDSRGSNTDILKKIANFLLQEYDQDRKLSGLIYVQSISDPRFTGQSSRNLRMFGELCGSAAYKNVVVLTTFWELVPTPEVGDKREERLKSNYFAKLVEGGAQFMRHDCTVESTRKVLRHFLPMPPTITQFQKEIRKEGKSFTETSAGSVHSQEVEKALVRYKKEIAELTAEMAELKENNKVTRQDLEKELAELRSSLAGQEREQEELKKGLDEERELRKRLVTFADELRAKFLRRPEIQSLSKEERARKLQEFQEGNRDAIDRALREARKRPLRSRLMEIADDIPLPNFIGKPILGGVGLGLSFDASRTREAVRQVPRYTPKLLVEASWKKDRIIKRDNNVMVGGLPTDIVIPVMGATGVGKSTFINILLGKDAMLVGHDMSSCTSTLQYAIVDNPSPCKGHRVVIVDTPGFNETYQDDEEILRRIAVWLAQSYDENMTLGGIIYLQSIAEKRMKVTTCKKLDMLCQLCGDEALARVVLGTTNWEEVDENVGEKREQQLAGAFWNTVTTSGSKPLRFDKTERSARVLLDAILRQLKFGVNGEILDDNVLRIQNKIVKLERRIPSTKAGKKLRFKLEQLREIQNYEANSEKAMALLASIEKQIPELHISNLRKLYFKILRRNPV